MQASLTWPDETPPIPLAPNRDDSFGYRGNVVTLAPPYEGFVEVRAVDDRLRPPLGSIVVGDANASIIATLAELTVAAMQWPWVIPCVVIPPGEEAPDGRLMVITELRDRLVIVRRLGVSGSTSIPRVLDAIRRRGEPSPLVLARWVSKRIGAGELEPLLLAQFREALEGTSATESASVSTFCRYFARVGEYTARDWRALARFCAHAADRNAGKAGVRPSTRTLADYAKRYLGMVPRDVSVRIGWEWVMERALRLAGYV